MKKALVLIFILALIAAGAAFLVKKEKKDGIRYRTEPVSRGDIRASVTATGTMNAVITVLVGTQVSGTVKELYADFNTPVKKGQLLAQIDPAPFEAQYEQARANYSAAKANVEKADAALADAKRIYERNKALIAGNFIPQSDFDTSESNYESAKAESGAARAQVSQADAAMKFAQTNLTYTKIVSPVDGTVISRSVDVGQTVAASFQTPTLFTIARDLKKMQIDTNINEADIGRVRLGQVVDFTVDAYPEKSFRGLVTQIRIAPISVQNVVTYDVVITVSNPELLLMPGMTANVSIIVAESKGVLKVPNAALRFRMPQGQAEQKPQKAQAPGGAPVWVLDEAGRPKRLSITTGISDGNFTEVASADPSLREGTKVIVEYLGKTEKTGAATPRLF